MPYTDLLTADRIVQMVAPGTRDQVLDVAARLLGDDSPEQTPAIASGLRRREAVGSTGIGRGVAIPHCRSDACSEPRAAFIRLATPVDFASRDGEPVDMVFAMTVPGDHAQQQHLDTLSELAGRFADAGFRESVRGAPDIAALRAVLLQQRAPLRTASG